MLVVYESKNGHTRQYAQWIASEFSTIALPLSELKPVDWKQSDVIVFGGGIYMGKIRGLKKVLRLSKDRPLVLFASGANQGTDADLAYVKSRNLSATLQSKLPFFFLPSDMDLDNTKGLLKWVMTKVVAAIEKKTDKTEADHRFLTMMKPPTSRMDPSQIQPLVRFVSETWPNL